MEMNCVVVYGRISYKTGPGRWVILVKYVSIEGKKNTCSVQGKGTLGQTSFRPYKKYKDSIIKRLHAPTKANSCTKYEQDLWNIVGYGVVTNHDSKHQLVSIRKI